MGEAWKQTRKTKKKGRCTLQNCTNCTKQRLWINTGRRDENGAVIRRCGNCGQCQSEPPPQGLQLGKRVWYYDIETSKIEVLVKTFQLKQHSDYLSWKDIKETSFLLCWSGAWITKDTTKENIRVFSNSITPDEAIQGSDVRCLTVLRDFMDKADRWAGHNIKAFDTKKVNARLIFNRMTAPDFSVKQIDTLSIVKKYFKNDSNALGYWLERLGQIGKDKMESDDWDKCKAGDQKALNKMQKYNKQDVRGGIILLLELRDYLASGGIDIFK
jgi:hypothetical protein